MANGSICRNLESMKALVGMKTNVGMVLWACGMYDVNKRGESPSIFIDFFIYRDMILVYRV